MWNSLGHVGTLAHVAPSMPVKLRAGTESRNGSEGCCMIVRRDRGMLAVLIMLDVGFHAGRTSTVSAADIADRAGLARRGVEPLLQALARSGPLGRMRGRGGGYRLGRPRRDIHLDEIFRIATAEDAGAE